MCVEAQHLVVIPNAEANHSQLVQVLSKPFEITMLRAI